jgi:hypothetical protein
MRKIISGYQRKRNQRRNQIIVGVILVFVMVFSTLGFAFQGGGGGDLGDNQAGNTAEYNGFEFVNQNGLWVLGSFVFRNLPQQIEDIGFGLNDINSYQGKPLYIYSEDEGAEIEISVNIGQVAQRVQKACVEGSDCQGDFPTKTCEDNFIIIKESSTSMIIQENNCVYIEGSKEDLVGLADQFLFKILGIR